MPEVNNNEIIWKIAAAMYPNKKTTDSQGVAITNFNGVDRSVVRELLALLDQFIPKWVQINNENPLPKDGETVLILHTLGHNAGCVTTYTYHKREKKKKYHFPEEGHFTCDNGYYVDSVANCKWQPLPSTDHPYTLLLNHLEMTFSRMVELLNQEVYKYQEHKGQLTTMMDVVRAIDSFIAHNPTSKNETKSKLLSIKEYMLKEVTDNAAQILNTTTP